MEINYLKLYFYLLVFCFSCKQDKQNLKQNLKQEVKDEVCQCEDSYDTIVKRISHEKDSIVAYSEKGIIKKIKINSYRHQSNLKDSLIFIKEYCVNRKNTFNALLKQEKRRQVMSCFEYNSAYSYKDHKWKKSEYGFNQFEGFYSYELLCLHQALVQLGEIKLPKSSLYYKNINDTKLGINGNDKIDLYDVERLEKITNTNLRDHIFFYKGEVITKIKENDTLLFGKVIIDDRFFKDTFYVNLKDFKGEIIIAD